MRCEACPLGPGPCVPPERLSSGHLILVGEAPGEEEVRSSRPFVGRSGKLLRASLEKLGIKPDVITNLVQCRPPANRDPHKKEIQACWDSGQGELIRAASLVVAVGSVASKWFLGRGVEETHGQVWTSVLVDAPVYVVRHPAGVLRDLPRLFPEFEADLGGLKRFLSRSPPSAPVLPPGYLACDLETTGLDPRSDNILGVAEYDAVGVWQVWDEDRADAIWDYIFQHKTVWFNGAAFDLHWAPERYQHEVVDDVLLMARILQRPTGGLARLVMADLGLRHTTIGELAERYGGEVPVEELKVKALADVRHTAALFLLYRDELKRTGLWEVYELERSVAPIVRQVERNGIPLNIAYLEEFKKRLEQELQDKYADLGAQMPIKLVQLKTKVKEIPPNPASRDQVAAHLRSLGVQWKQTTKTGKPALDAATLATIDHPFAREYQTAQGVKKGLDFVRGLLREQRDGTLYPEFNQLGARSGRFSSGGEDE